MKKIYNAGHDIGNHSNTHPHSSQLSLEENKKNIMECHDKIKNLLSFDAFLYRPPFGEYNNTVLDAAKECGYYPIQWDVDTSQTDAQRLIRRDVWVFRSKSQKHPSFGYSYHKFYIL